VTPNEEVQALMNEGIRFAAEMLEEHGEFLPYGFAMDVDGEIRPVAAVDGDEEPPPEEIIEFLNIRFRRGADSGQYKATALFVNVRVTPPGGRETDAVQVGLEHRAGNCLNVYFPYGRSIRRVMELGELFADHRDGVVFQNQR